MRELVLMLVVGMLGGTAARSAEPKVFKNSIGMKLRLIPAGEFLMGSPADETDRDDHEGPQHRVKISKSFYMGMYEVTQHEFKAITGKNPSHFSLPGRGMPASQVRSNFPVENVSWLDALDFCNRLSAKDELSPCYQLTSVEREYGSIKWADVEILSGTGYRLPTEAEWEYACRAGTTTPYHFGKKLNGARANQDGNLPYGTNTKGVYLERPTPVGSYSANAFGLHDMHGNIYEWCSDWYDEDYYEASPTSDPRGPATGRVRVLRGGSWFSNAWSGRSAYRGWGTLNYRTNCLGFRVVRSPIKPAVPTDTTQGGTD